MNATDRFCELVRGTASFMARANNFPTAPESPPTRAAVPTGGRSRSLAAGGRKSNCARNTVPVLSDATRAAIGATPKERRAAMRADLEAMVLAKKAGEEAHEAELIQAEFGFDQLEPLPPGMGALPADILAERDAGIPRDQRPYYLRED